MEKIDIGYGQCKDPTFALVYGPFGLEYCVKPLFKKLFFQMDNCVKNTQHILGFLTELCDYILIRKDICN